MQEINYAQEGNGMGVVLTHNAHSTLRTHTLNVGTSFSNIIPPESGNRRVVFGSIMNNDTAVESLDIQYTDASNSNETRLIVDNLPVQNGVTSFPISADISIAAGDSLQLRSTGTDLRAVFTTDLL